VTLQALRWSAALPPALFVAICARSDVHPVGGCISNHGAAVR